MHRTPTGYGFVTADGPAASEGPPTPAQTRLDSEEPLPSSESSRGLGVREKTKLTLRYSELLLCVLPPAAWQLLRYTINMIDLDIRLGWHVDSDAVAGLCRKYHVRELSLFGSAVRGELRPDSDIDLLVDFEPDSRPGFFTLTGLAEDFSELLNRSVDVVPKLGLKEVIRDQVLSEAEVFYAA